MNLVRKGFIDWNSGYSAKRIFTYVGILSAILGCGHADEKILNQQYSQIKGVSKSDGKVGYIDTHDNYAHTAKVDPLKFNYFKKVDGKPAISLTFDCAWVDNANGMKIIDFLKIRKIKTTIFISGPFIFENYKMGSSGGVANLNKNSYGMIKRLIDDGHEFGNHTWTHPHNLKSGETISRVDWTAELKDLEIGWNNIVKKIYGTAIPANAKMKPFWRAPFGEYDDRSLKMAAKAGYPLHFGWNSDSRDSTGLPDCRVDGQNPKCLNPRKLTQYVLDFGVKNDWKIDGMVVLSHLQNPYDWTGSADGLARLVDTYQAKGFTFRKISEMFNRSLAPDVTFE